MTYRLSVVIERDEHGFYAFAPGLQGCQTQGDTLDEVLVNMREAAQAYLSTMTEDEKDAALSREILTTNVEVRAA